MRFYPPLFGLISCLGFYKSGLSHVLKNTFTQGQDNERFRSLRANRGSAELIFFMESYVKNDSLNLLELGP